MEESQILKVMPNNVEAEMSVIGSMIMDKDAISIASEMLLPDDFYNKSYGAIYKAIVELYNEDKPVDIVILSDRLKQNGASDEVANLDYIGQLVFMVPTSTNVREYAQIVKDMSVRRNVIKATQDISAQCYASNNNTEDVLADTEKKIFELVQRKGGRDITPIREVAKEAIERIELASRAGGTVTGIPTGYYDLDYKTAGLQKSDLVLIAARPSMGKTAFVLNIAQHVVLKEDVATAIFSLEMSKVQLFNRLIAMESGVSSQNIRTGKLSETEWNKILAGAGTLGRSKLLIDDTPGISIAELRSKCRKMKLEHNLGLVIIDYLQLMTGNGKTDSRQQEISDISRSLKALAREIDAPVVALSQLSRAVEQRPDHRPMLSDLRESGAIEQDADVVMFIYRDDYYNKETDKKGISEIIIAKQRNGPIGTVELAWLAEYTKFANLEKQRYDN